VADGHGPHKPERLEQVAQDALSSVGASTSDVLDVEIRPQIDHIKLEVR
jgi:hypothetical protein